MKRFAMQVLAVVAMLVSTTYCCHATETRADSAVDTLLTTAVNAATFDNFSGHNIVVESQFSYREKLVTEVGRYLASIHAPSDITAEHIVDCCLQNDFNITFLLAQGTLETGMGNAGAGKSRKSVFGVVKRRFATRDDAVTHYVNLVKNRYYRGSWPGLMRNFVSKDGYRYAAHGYERRLQDLYNTIRKKYPGIHKFQYDRPVRSEPPEKERPDSFVELACSFLGTPYHWGSTGPESFDCSGFTRYVYKQFNVTLPRTAHDQYLFTVPVTDRKDVRPGDLIFFQTKRSGRRIGHVGMIIDVDDTGYTYIHAESRKTGVRTTRIAHETHHRHRCAGIRRVKFDDTYLS